MRRLLPVALYGAIGAIFLAGAFRGFDRLGGKDWNAFLGQAQAEVVSIQEHGQFPLWNPWRRGGEVSFAQPESMLLSPVTPLTLLVGVVPAFKLLIIPVFVLGCLGMHALARHFALSGPARYTPALVFFGSSVFPLYVVGGLPNWLFGMAALPWLFLFHRRSMDDTRWSLAAGAVWAACLFCGSVYHFVFFPLLLAVDALALASGFGLELTAERLHRLGLGPPVLAALVVDRSPGLAPGGEFVQSRVLPNPAQWGGELFESVVANRGNVLAASDIPFRSRVRAEGDRGYRGEAYLLLHRGSVTTEFTPNVIRATVEATRADTLVINQNYFPGWRVGGTGRAARCWDRLLAVPVPGGRSEVVLRFSSPAAGAGLVLTLLASALAVAQLTLSRTLRLPTWATIGVSGALLVAGLAFAGSASERGLPVRSRWTQPPARHGVGERLGIPTNACAPSTALFAE